MAARNDVSPRWVLRRAVKVATAGALIGLGARRAVKAWQRHRVGGARVVLLSYHRATHDFDTSARDGLPSMFVSARTLRRHLELVGRLRDVVSLADARRLLAEGEKAPARDLVVVTFDDGYADNHEVALPVLAALHVPATFFVATGYLGTSHRFPHDRLHAALTELERRGVPAERAGLPRGPQLLLSACAEGSPARTLTRLIERLSHEGLVSVADALEHRLRMHEDDLPLDGRAMSWDEVRALVGEGMDVGGHTVHHAVLANLPLADARREVVGCARDIEAQTGRRPRHFAYPNGYHTPMMRELVRDCGFEAAVTTEDRENVRGGDAFELRRKVLWENSTLGPVSYSQALAAVSLDGVLTALGLARTTSGERPDAPPEPGYDQVENRALVRPGLAEEDGELGTGGEEEEERTPPRTPSAESRAAL